MELVVYGTGCAKCKTLHEAVLGAVKASGASANVSKVEDIEKIMAAGVMRTPALEVDGRIVATGRIPSLQEIQGWLKGGA
jgi:small redox-active disulfide protein 2